MDLDQYLLPKHVFTAGLKATRYTYVDGLLVEVNVHTGEPVTAPKRPKGVPLDTRWATPTAKGSPTSTPKLRVRVFERDGGCVRCRTRANLSVHHVVHRSKGGSNDPSNLQTLCTPCHRHVHDVLRVPSGERVGELDSEAAQEHERTAPPPREQGSWWNVQGRELADEAYGRWLGGEAA